MADSKLTDLTAGTALTGAELLYSVQSGNDVKITAAQLATYTTTTGGAVSGTGVSGQVSFWTGTSTQGGDTGFIWDNTNKRFGIGITVPTARFQLVQSADTVTGGMVLTATDGNGAGIYRQSGTSGPFVIRNTGTDTVFITNSSLGLLTTAPTHTLTLGSTSTGIAAYNTSDQTVNYERVRSFWTGSVYTTASENGGTGTNRNMAWSVNAGTMTFQNVASASGNGGMILIDRTGGHTCNFGIQGGFTGSAITQYGAIISNQVSQTSTASYEALRISPNIASTGSGPVYLANFGTNSSTNNGGTHTLQVAINSFGQISTSTTGRMNIGTGHAGSKLSTGTDGFTTSNTYSTQGFGLQINGAIYTSTSSTGTIAIAGVNTFGTPTLTANSATTITEATNLYISAPPIAGTNVTFTRSVSVLVDGGLASFRGGLATDTANTTTNFNAQGATSIGLTSTATSQFAGSSSVQYRVLLNGVTTQTLATGTNYANMVIASAPITTFTSGTHTWLANAVVNSLGTVTSGGATVTNTASLFVSRASTGGTNNYAAYVESANVPFSIDSSGAVVGQMTQLFRVLNLNSAATANTLAYTNNTGKTISIAQVAVVCMTATAVTVGPTIGIGTASGTSDIFPATAMTALTTTSRQHYLTASGGSVVVPNGGTIYINLTAATGTAQTVTLAFAGFAY